MMNNPQQKQFLKLYEPVHNNFERFCRARVFGRMDYQDLMHDTLLIAYQKFDTLQHEKAFLSFLIGISIKLLSNQHKKKKEELLMQPENLELHDTNSNTERDAEVYLLHQAMNELPDDMRECLILFEITGFSIKEIMEIQQASESAVKQRLKRGREKLIDILTFESAYKTKEVKNGTK